MNTDSISLDEKHPMRENAEKAYELAAARWMKASCGSCADEFVEADRDYQRALERFSQALVKYPTRRELHRRQVLRNFANCGLLD